MAENRASKRLPVAREPHKYRLCKDFTTCYFRHAHYTHVSTTFWVGLRVPPGNRLEQLGGDRKGQHSIRINDQFRVCFVWEDGDGYDVEVTDYH